MAFEHIEQFYSPLNLANMKTQKLKFVQNTAPDNQRVLNFMRNHFWRILDCLFDTLTVLYSSMYIVTCFKFWKFSNIW